MSVQPSSIRPRVLIADDEPETCRLLRGVLEEARIQVVGEALSGVQAVAMAESLEPDVVLMDLRMPYMDGLEATADIKASRPGIQVIVLTMYDEVALVQGAEEAGAYCFLVKGCPPSMIVDMVRRAWQFARAAEGRSA